MEIRIFPTSREEFRTINDFRTWLHVGLRLGGGEYYLRSRGRVSEIEPGSIGLFRFNDVLVGEAVLQRGPQPTEYKELDVVYQEFVVFDPSSIRIFRPPVPVRVLGELTDRDLSVPNSYFKFQDWSIYPKLMAEVVKGGSFC